MPKVMNYQVLNAQGALQRLVGRTDIPSQYFVGLVRFTRKFNDELSVINEAVNAIIRKYVEEGADSVPVEDEHYGDCLAEVNNLRAQESKLNEKPVRLPSIVINNGIERDLFVLTEEGVLDDILVLEPFIEIIER